METDTVLIADTTDYSQEPMQTYKPGRRCVICGAILSIYQPKNKCWCHTEGVVPKKKPKPHRCYYVGCNEMTWGKYCALHNRPDTCAFPGCTEPTNGKYCVNHKEIVGYRRRAGWPIVCRYAPPIRRKSADSLAGLIAQEAAGEFDNEPWHKTALEHIESGILTDRRRNGKKRD